MVEKILNLVSPGYFRFFLAVVVLIHHSVGFFAFGALAVYLFFVLSGYWVTRLWLRNYQRYNRSWIVFWISRWWRVVPLLLVSMICLFAVHLNFPHLYPPSNKAPMASFDWWLRLLLGVGSSKQNTGNPVIWSLDVEMQFYLLFPLMIWTMTLFTGAWNRVSTTFVLAFAMIYGLTKFATGSASTDPNLAIFLFFFLIGVFHARKAFPIANAVGVCQGIALFALAILVIAILPETRHFLTNYISLYPPEHTILQNMLMFILAIPLVPLALWSVSNRGATFDRKIGDLAYPLYLTHLIPLRFYHETVFENSSTKVGFLLLAWSVCVCFAVLLSLLVDRPSESLRRKWLSRRSLSTEMVR